MPTPDPLIDQETVREIESYYAKKRLRDQARAGKASDDRHAAIAWQSLAKPAQSGVESRRSSVSNIGFVV